MEEGLIDQEGFRTLQMKSLDLTIRMTWKNRVISLYPGPTLQTKGGVGIGSTLGQLLDAHGDYTLSRIPIIAQSHRGISKTSIFISTAARPPARKAP